MNDRRRQRIKAARQMQKRDLRNILSQLNDICSKNLYEWTWDAKKYSEVLREWMEPFAKKFNDTMVDVYEDLVKSDVVYCKISTRDPELIQLLQEAESDE